MRLGRDASAGEDRESDEYLAATLRTAEGHRLELERQLKASHEKVAWLERLADLTLELELDSVFQRVLDLALEAVRADGACLVVESTDGALLVASRGAGDAEAAAPILPAPGAGHRAVVFRYHLQPGDQDGEPIRVAVVVPVPDAGSPARLVFFWHDEKHEVGEVELEAIEDLTGRAGPAIGVARRFDDARRRADLDPLTGLLNRRRLLESLERETSRARRYEHPLAVLLLDVDDFKLVNDRFGHATGDRVLVEVAKRLGDSVRGADLVCRAGGDEFVVILPEGTVSDAEQVFGRVRAVFAYARIDPVERLTISGGITELVHEDEVESLLERADHALYHAKRTGKDRVVVAPTANDDGGGFSTVARRSDV